MPSKQEKSYESCRRSLGLTFVTWLFVLAVAILNPFGMKDASDQESSAVYFRLTAPFYGVGAPSNAKTAVILINDESLKALGHSYPPSAPFFSDLLASLERAGAEAVFFDALLVDDRPGIDALRDAILRTRQTADMGVFFPSGLQRDRGQQTNCDEPVLAEIVDAATYAPAVYLDDQPGHYTPRLRVVCESSDRMAPATAMYESFAGTLPPELPESFVIRWGSAPPKVILDAYDSHSANCPPAADTLLEATGISARQVAIELLHGIKDQSVWDCPTPFIPSIPAENLMTGTIPPPLAELLDGSYLFVGANLIGIDDTTLSHVHGPKPGVFAHAMAFHNLVTQQDRVYRPWPELIWRLAWDDVIDLFLVFIVVLFARKQNARLSASRTASFAASLRAILRVGLGSFALLFATVLFFVEILRFEPTNWLGVLALAILLLHPLWEKLADALFDFAKSISFKTIRKWQTK